MIQDNGIQLMTNLSILNNNLYVRVKKKTQNINNLVNKYKMFKMEVNEDGWDEE